MGKLVTTKEKPLFRQTHELAKAVRSLKRLSTKAMDVLEKALASPDEKLRVQAAQQLLKFYMDAAKETNQDALNRLILDVKMSGVVGQGSTADDDNTPALNFDEIHPDFQDAENVIDLSDVNKLG